MLFIEFILVGLAVYLFIGCGFACVFVFRGAQVIDKVAASGSIAFKALIFPAATMLWPVLLKKWIRA